MCGIAGMLGFGTAELLRDMTDRLAHRGPDGEYFYHDEALHLGSRRLAILDPAGGVQPVYNEDHTIVAVYNGEIYNSPELRKGLLDRGHVLRSHCDTEILPHLYEEEGIEFVHRLNGMFAFALWDKRQRILFLARDPIGIKPLVYAVKGGLLAFASEAKAVVASGLVQPELDETSLHLTMNLRYIPGARTLFAGIQRLPPGHILEADATSQRLRRYSCIDWSPDETLAEEDWLSGIRDHLERAVNRQLLSDVPVGVSLSGGIDSTSIVAMIRKRSTGPLQTFTLGFGEPWDETTDARDVARHYGTDHHEIVLHEPVMQYLREAIYFSEEPKVNTLQLFLLHRFVGSHLKVSLSGLGGDELFAGYDIYRFLRRLRRPRALMPATLMARTGAPILSGLAIGLGRLERPSLDLYIRMIEWAAALHDGARSYLLLRNAWDSNPSMLSRVYSAEFRDRLTVRCRESFDGYFSRHAPVERSALQAEFQTKLVNDLLQNEDAMSMAHSVESRVPFLDLELVRFAARIPDRLRFDRGPKGLLKLALAPVLPPKTLQKGKWGFTVDPVEQYKKDLRSTALNVLAPDRLRRTGIFNPQFVADVLAATPHQRLRWHYFMLWQMIGLELWHEVFVS